MDQTRPIAGHHEASIRGVGHGVHIADVEVDPETGRVTVQISCGAGC